MFLCFMFVAKDLVPKFEAELKMLIDDSRHSIEDCSSHYQTIYCLGLNDTNFESVLNVNNIKLPEKLIQNIETMLSSSLNKIDELMKALKGGSDDININTNENSKNKKKKLLNCH